MHVIFTCNSGSMQISQVSCIVREKHTFVGHLTLTRHGQATLTDLLGLSAAQYLGSLFSQAKQTRAPH